MLLEITQSGPILTNAVLLGCTKTHKAVVVDAPPESGEWFLQRVQALGLNVQMLLLTHSHWDHMADMSFLKQKLEVPLLVHELDAPNLRKPGSDGLPLLADIAPVEPDAFLTDGQIISVGDLSLEVIHTPGHSPGGVCFYLPEQGILLSGDTLFQGSIGRLDFLGSSQEQMWKSLKKLAKLPPNTRVIPGHGGETTIAEESWLSDAKTYFGG